MERIFLRRFITVDEILIHHYTTGIKKPCIAKVESARKKVKKVSSAEKLISNIFWDCVYRLPLKR